MGAILTRACKIYWKELVFEELTNLKYHCGLLGEKLDDKKYSALIFKGEELKKILCTSLSWNTPKDIVIIKKVILMVR